MLKYQVQSDRNHYTSSATILLKNNKWNLLDQWESIYLMKSKNLYSLFSRKTTTQRLLKKAIRRKSILLQAYTKEDNLVKEIKWRK